MEKIPYLSTTQMIEVDRAMIEDYHIELVQMMENAGRNLAHLARMRFLDGNPAGRMVVVLAGSGGNGGGAMVCGRRLHNWGAYVQVFLTKSPQALSGVPAHQLDVLRRMGVPVAQTKPEAADGKIDLIVDGLIGYSLSGAPRGTVADLIRWANDRQAQGTPILALDTPSGVDAGTGTVLPPAIRATATLTLALPKEGLRATETEHYVGELYLADISVPPDLYADRLGVQVDHLFAQDEIVRLR